MEMKKKKSYTTPKLQTRKIELGVFGAYGPNDQPGPGGNSGKNGPISVVGRLGLHME